MRYLITPTLHSSWSFYRSMDSKTKADFLNTLLKKPIEPTEAMLAGRAFEDAVLASTEDKAQLGDGQYLACVNEIARIVRGGLWQERTYYNITLGGMDFLLYGKADVIIRDRIYDIKFTANYEIGKYSSSIQHLAYMAGSGIKKFDYLISDGRSVWREAYVWEENSQQRLETELSDMVQGIMADAEFNAAYIANWQSYPRVKVAA